MIIFEVGSRAFYAFIFVPGFYSGEEGNNCSSDHFYSLSESARL